MEGRMTPKGIRSAIIVCSISLILFAAVWYFTFWWVALLIWIASFVAVILLLSSPTKPEPEDPRLGRW